MKLEWEKENFSNCIKSVHVERKNQVQANSYLAEGKYPVIDQGQDLIAGWTNDEKAVIREGLPYVIFGDHTRVFKWVDFPFALGADGTKLLKTREDINPRYFYFHLQSFDIPSRGYSRHYRLLKEKIIYLPPLSEQKKIAVVLLKIQRAIEMQEKILRSLRDLKKTTMQFVFTRGLRGEKTKMTEIGGIPKSWDVVKVEEAVSSFRFDRKKQIPASQYMNKGEYPIVDQGQALISGYTNEEDKVIHPPYPMIIFGDHTRAIKYVDFAFALGGDGTKPLTILPNFNPLFLFYAISRLDVPARGYNRHYCLLSQLLIPKPALITEQEEIGIKIHSLDRKTNIHLSKKANLQDFFKTMLNKLMTDEIRMKDLNIDLSEVEA